MRINLFDYFLSLTFISNQIKKFIFANFHSYLSIPIKRSVRINHTHLKNKKTKKKKLFLYRRQELHGARVKLETLFFLKNRENCNKKLSLVFISLFCIYIYIYIYDTFVVGHNATSARTR